MEGQPRSAEPGTLPLLQAVLDQLDRVLSSPPFESAERSTRLLRFVVEQTLQGHADRLKEYTLATQVLGRSAAFDPRTDPIVRAEAARLRDRLSRYYAKQGQTDPLLIDLPKGSYVPRFERRVVSPAPLKESEEPATRKRLSWTMVTVAATASMIAVVLLGFTGTTRSSGELSIAVLPLADLSSDAGRDFFADGVTDEIAAALARVPNLKVVARTSAYAFKNRAEPAREVGAALGAAHLIEGSVRQNGGRVRIAVQLTKAETGLQLWSAVYDRELTDIFAVQEDIARNVSASLNVTLGLERDGKLVNSIDSESYQQYLRVRPLFLARGEPGGHAHVVEATALLEKIVARNPNYAPAWESLTRAYFYLVRNDPAFNGPPDEARRLAEAYRPKMIAAALRTFQLDPNFLGGYALGLVQFERGNLLSASELMSKVLALDPNDPHMLNAYSVLLAIVGRVKEAIPLRQQLRAVEPLVPQYQRFAARYLWVGGQNEAAIAILNASAPDAPGRSNDLAMIYASMGRYGEAADVLEKAPTVDISSERLKEATRLLRAAHSRTAVPDIRIALRGLGWIYLYTSAPERALEAYERDVEIGFIAPYPLPSIWHASYAPVRKTERFKSFVSALGLVDYWRAKGWPEFCRPTTGHNFACD
jgi:adenylate cyclase